MPGLWGPEVQYPGQPGAVQSQPEAWLCDGRWLWTRLRAREVPVQGDSAGHPGQPFQRQEAQGIDTSYLLVG